MRKFEASEKNLRKRRDDDLIYYDLSIFPNFYDDVK